MRIGVFSDIHIHDYTRFSVNGSRLDNCLNCLEEILNYDLDLFLFLGDLFDSNISVKTDILIRTADIINDSGKLIFAISGNHDMASKNIGQHFYSSLDIIDRLCNNFILLDNCSVVYQGINLIGVPYYHKNMFNEVMKNIDILNKSYLLLHTTPKQIANKVIPYQVDLEDIEFSGFEYIFVGHIHKHQELIPDKAVMVGSPLHRDAGDVGEDKGFLIFDTETNLYEFTSLRYPKFDYSITDDSYLVEVKTRDDIKTNNLLIKKPVEILEDFVLSKKGDKSYIEVGKSYL